MIKLKPELIARQEIINVALLTEGATGPAVISLNPFTDVIVETADREEIESRRAKLTVLAAILLAIATIAISAVAIVSSITATRQNRALAGAAICSTLTQFSLTTTLGMTLVDRDITVQRAKTGQITTTKL